MGTHGIVSPTCPLRPPTGDRSAQPLLDKRGCHKQSNPEEEYGQQPVDPSGPRMLPAVPEETLPAYATARRSDRPEEHATVRESPDRNERYEHTTADGDQRGDVSEKPHRHHAPTDQGDNDGDSEGRDVESTNCVFV